jgi:hypothetical protein
VRWSLAAIPVVLASCAFDWDGYDPRLSAPNGPQESCEPGALVSCYSGAAGTAGVGVCHEGTRRCLDDRTFGPCEDEVTPSTEVCANTTDDDCDGVVLDPEDGCGCTAGEIVACYDGPAMTAGVGSCREGGAKCNAQGNGVVGGCIGQVVPVLEECATGDDDDCDGVTNDWCGTWSKRYAGTMAEQHAWGAVYDVGGDHLVIGGEIYSATDLGAGPLVGEAAGDGYVAKIDAASGDTEWARIYDGAGYQTVYAVAADAAGDFYLAGYFDTGLTPGGALAPLVAAEGLDGFVMKVSGSDGTPIWIWHVAGSLDQEADALAVDTNGNVVATGTFAGTMTLGADTYTATANDGWLASLDAGTGAVQWSKTFGGTGSDYGRDVTVDAGGDIYLVGDFADSIDLGAGPVNDQTDDEGFVARLDSAGNLAWLYPLLGDGAEEVWSVALDPAGNVLVLGEFDGDIDLGGGVVASLGEIDAFVVRLTAGGAYGWSTVFGSEGEDQAKDVAAGPGGEVLVGLDLHANVTTIGTNAVVSGGQGDMVLVVLDQSGAPQVVRRFGELTDENVRQVLMPASDTLLMTADCDGGFDFGAGWLGATNGYEDVCIARLDL